jgi:hypothetical protein
MSDTQVAQRSRITQALERRLGKRYQQFIFWRAMRRFLRDVPDASKPFDQHLLTELVHGWGNSWSAQHEFLSACLQHVRETDGPVLECGSGLSTVLLGAVAQARGIRVYSLEHEPKWATRVQKYLRKYRINSVTMCVAPIRSYGDFDWYSLPSLQTIPPRLALVVCDGPPGGTRGGRYGLVPVILDKLREDCVILLDDGARDEERSIASRWGQMLGGNPELIGNEKPFIRLKAGRTNHPLQTAPIAENPSIQDDLPQETGQDIGLPDRA